MTDDPLAEFSVGASMDGEMTLDHDVQPASDGPWCWWTTAIDNGTTLPQLADLAREHLADKHDRTEVTSFADLARGERVYLDGRGAQHAEPID